MLYNKYTDDYSIELEGTPKEIIEVLEYINKGKVSVTVDANGIVHKVVDELKRESMIKVDDVIYIK